MSKEILSVNDLTLMYGDALALRSVNVQVNTGETVALIGSNGAGKTSLLRTILGFHRAKSGLVTFLGERTDTRAPEVNAAAGLALVPEGRRLFSQLTVEENLTMGAYLRKDKPGIAESFEQVFSLFPRLLERRSSLAGQLSGGEQQMCAIGRALMMKPRLLLIDELSLGLAPVAVDQLIEALGVLSQSLPVLLVEQDAGLALEITDRSYVLSNGEVILHGASKDLLSSPEVHDAYLALPKEG